MLSKKPKVSDCSIVESRYYSQSTNKVIKSTGIYGIEVSIRHADFEPLWYRHDIRYLVDISVENPEAAKAPTLFYNIYPFSSDVDKEIIGLVSKNAKEICQLFLEKSIIGMTALFDVKENKLVTFSDFTRGSDISYERFKKTGVIYCTKQFPSFATFGDSLYYVETSTKSVSDYCCFCVFMSIKAIMPMKEGKTETNTFGGTLFALISGLMHNKGQDQNKLITQIIDVEASGNNTGPIDYVLYRMRNVDLTDNEKMLSGIDGKYLVDAIAKSNEHVRKEEKRENQNYGYLDDKALADIIAMNNGKVLLSTAITCGISRVAALSIKSKIVLELDIKPDNVKQAYFFNTGLFVEVEDSSYDTRKVSRIIEGLKQEWEYDDIFPLMS